jgi:hypothetical protein
LPLPQPVPGLVIRYSYLWRSEYQRGQEEGVKDRPCAVVMAVTNDQGDDMVTVLPVTHAPPADRTLAVEIPHAVKRRLGLDDERSWVVLNEANRFAWPGPDLRMAENGNPDSVAYGLLPRALFKEISSRFGDAVEARLAGLVRRSE